MLYFFINSEVELSNRTLKRKLIEKFGEDIGFSYPKDKRMSQVVFSRNIPAEDLVEAIRSKDAVKACAEILKEECVEYEFLLDNSYKSASDLLASYNNYKIKRPPSWETFFDTIFPFRKNSEALRRKSDTVFQIMYTLIHNSTKIPPLHVFVAETIHDISRSKRLVNMMNRLGVAISYNEMLTIDNIAAKRIINETGENRVPIAETMRSSTIIQGAMDNF